MLGDDLNKAEKRILYALRSGTSSYMSEKQLRKSLNRKSSLKNQLDKLIQKDYLDIWYNAEKKGIDLYHFSDRIRKNVDVSFRLHDVIRPQYFCTQCKAIHFSTTDPGKKHKKFASRMPGPKRFSVGHFNIITTRPLSYNRGRMEPYVEITNTKTGKKREGRVLLENLKTVKDIEARFQQMT